MKKKNVSLEESKKKGKMIALQLCYASVIPDIMTLIDNATSSIGVDRLLKMARNKMG